MMMISTPQFPNKGIWEGFFTQPLALNNWSGKTRWEMIYILGLKKLAWLTRMGPTKLSQEMIMVYSQNA